MKKITSAFACILSLAACQDNESSFHTNDDKASLGLHKIEIEASKRGINIDWNDLTILDIDRTGGLSRYDPNTHIIYLDTTDWSYKNTFEELLTHEFGHAILRRQHDFSKLPNGMYKTVMGNTSNRQYSGWSIDSVRYRQTYYYDELFDPSTPAPEWAMAHIQ